MRFLLSLGLLCFAAAAPLLEESVEEALEQSQADSAGEASWSKDSMNNWPILKRYDKSRARPGGVWKGQNVLETDGITHKIRKKGLARHTDKEAVEIETISSILRDFEDSLPSSDRSDSDDDDMKASKENFNLVNREDVSGKQSIEEAEIEKFKIFKKIFKKVKKGLKKFVKLFKKIKPKIKNRPRQRYDDDDDDDDDDNDMNDRRQPYKYAMVDSDTSIGVHVNYLEDRERELAEIEGLGYFLVDALKMMNSKLCPRSRTDEDDQEAVRNLQKWTDLARNFLNLLREKREKLKQRRTGSGPGLVESPTNELSTTAAPNVDQTWTTDRPYEMSQEQSLFRLYRKLIGRIRRHRSV